MGQELDTALAEASHRLVEEGVALEERVVGALDAWLGRYVGSLLASDIGSLLQTPAMRLEEMVDQETFYERLAAAIAPAMTEKDRRRLGVTPTEIAEALHTAAQGAKYLSGARAESPAEFVTRLTPVVHVVLAGLPAATTKVP
jgi:hypothetical protein